MAGPDDLLAELPAKNPEEPFSLRQDIADELRDHLECAVRRESLKDNNPQAVEARVIARFGNPRTIARKLWLDAMKEKLMMQKITLALVSLVAVVSLAVCGLMWSLARDFQTASTDLLSQSREVNAELLSQLSALADREPEGPSLMEWVPVKVQVVKNDEAKSPGEGFRVELQGHAISQTEMAYLPEETDESGTIDFGLVRPGSYEVNIRTPWNETLTRKIVVKPGSPHFERILAPDGPSEAYQVEPTVPWPKELEGQDVAVLVKIQRRGETKVGDETWRLLGDEQHLLIRPDGRFATYPDAYYKSSGHYQRNQDMILEHGQVAFRSNPEIFEGTFPWRGEQVWISELKVVKLPRDAGFPEMGDSLVGLSESDLLDEYIPGSKNSFEPLLYEKSPNQISKEAAQEWIIELSEVDLWVTRAMLVIEQFSNVPDAQVINMVTDYFRQFDHDRNLEISENEVSEERRRSLGDFSQFPISFEAFMKRAFENIQKSKS